MSRPRVGGHIDGVQGAAAARAVTGRARRRGRPFRFDDSYAVVLALVVMTYVVSVSITETSATSIVLTVQLATVWFALRISEARRGSGWSRTLCCAWPRSWRS